MFVLIFMAVTLILRIEAKEFQLSSQNPDFKVAMGQDFLSSPEVQSNLEHGLKVHCPENRLIADQTNNIVQRRENVTYLDNVITNRSVLDGCHQVKT